MIQLYTDGSYSIPRHTGGWAVVITKDGIFVNSHYEQIHYSDSSRAELFAFVKALELSQNEKEVIIYSDSNYVVNGYNNWAENWKKQDWKKSNGKNAKNSDLWRKVFFLKKNYIKVEWIKKDSHEFNILADSLAGF